MTWKELIKKAEKLGWRAWSDDRGIYALSKGELIFSVDGAFYICVQFTINPFHIFARNRTPNQMYQIMLALEDYEND